MEIVFHALGYDHVVGSVLEILERAAQEVSFFVVHGFNLSRWILSNSSRRSTEAVAGKVKPSFTVRPRTSITVISISSLTMIDSPILRVRKSTD